MQIFQNQKHILQSLCWSFSITWISALAPFSALPARLREHLPHDVLDIGFQRRVHDPQRGREANLEGSRVVILFTHLYYMCFIRVLDGGRWVMNL